MTGDIEARGGGILQIAAQAGGQELLAHFVFVAQRLLEELAEAPLEQAAVIPAEARDALGGRSLPGQSGLKQRVTMVEGDQIV